MRIDCSQIRELPQYLYESSCLQTAVEMLSEGTSIALRTYRAAQESLFQFTGHLHSLEDEPIRVEPKKGPTLLQRRRKAKPLTIIPVSDRDVRLNVIGNVTFPLTPIHPEHRPGEIMTTNPDSYVDPKDRFRDTPERDPSLGGSHTRGLSTATLDLDDSGKGAADF